MITKSQKIRLGIFISSAVAILLLLILALSINQFFKEKDVYYIAYRDMSVMGLDIGSSVKYLGINVGTIKEIEIDPQDINRIIVTIGLKKDTPIKNDVRADISTIGITGIKIIELRGGSNDAPTLEPGGFIRPGKSLTEDITGKAEIIADKIELILNNLLELTADTNQEKVFELVDNTNQAVGNINAVVSENKDKINRSFENIDLITSELGTASQSANRAISGLESIVTADSFRTAINALVKIANKIDATNIYNLVEQLNEAVIKANRVLVQSEYILKENRVKFYESMTELNETLKYLKSAAQQIDEDPSVLIGGSEPDNPPDDNLEQ